MVDKAARSARRYEEKLRLGACGRLSEEEIQRRVDSYTYRAYQNQALHLEVRQVLNGLGVMTTLDLMYHAYAGELGKLKRLDSYEARVDALRTVAAKWIARGLEEQALRAVAESVFNLPWHAAMRNQEARHNVKTSIDKDLVSQDDVHNNIIAGQWGPTLDRLF